MTKKTGHRIGYVRVSTFEQNADRQLAGVDLDKIFTDKASGKDDNRPKLQELLNYAREGDTVFVHSMDRLARNLDDLRDLVRTLTKKGVILQFMKESLIFSGDDSPMSTLMLSVMGAFAEFERSLIKERQREGIAVARKKGAYTGRPKSLTDDLIKELNERAADGEKKKALAKAFGISLKSVYNYLFDAELAKSDPESEPNGQSSVIKAGVQITEITP